VVYVTTLPESRSTLVDQRVSRAADIVCSVVLLLKQVACRPGAAVARVHSDSPRNIGQVARRDRPTAQSTTDRPVHQTSSQDSNHNRGPPVDGPVGGVTAGRNVSPRRRVDNGPAGAADVDHSDFNDDGSIDQPDNYKPVPPSPSLPLVPETRRPPAVAE